MAREAIQNERLLQKLTKLSPDLQVSSIHFQTKLQYDVLICFTILKKGQECVRKLIIIVKSKELKP